MRDFKRLQVHRLPVCLIRVTLRAEAHANRNLALLFALPEGAATRSERDSHREQHHAVARRHIRP